MTFEWTLIHKLKNVPRGAGRAGGSGSRCDCMEEPEPERNENTAQESSGQHHQTVQHIIMFKVTPSDTMRYFNPVHYPSFQAATTAYVMVQFVQLPVLLLLLLLLICNPSYADSPASCALFRFST
uniref:Uncharacterized protein n=1 Tax=Anopheles coluzzii TaxID=1518534 RepID=A0A8W7PKA5_ANOCL